MHNAFTIWHDHGRTFARIRGLAPGGDQKAPPLIIPVFIPMSGCPHRCSFCNQTAITGAKSTSLSSSSIHQSIRSFLAFVHDRNRPIQIAFYGGNFLGLPERQIRNLLKAATDYTVLKEGAGIRFSTRPDTISDMTLAILRDYPVKTIELGLQSMDDKILELTQRGHQAAQTISAIQMVKTAGYELGLQMMTGLPGETPQSAEKTARKIASMTPDFVRIYPTLVLKNSPLARQYQAGEFTPATLEETISLVCRLFLIFTAAQIPVIRLGLQADHSLSMDGTILAGPYHPSFGERVYSRAFYHLAAAALGIHSPDRPHVDIHVHSGNLSKMIGAGRENLDRLKTRFEIDNLSIRSNNAISPHHLEVDNRSTPNASK